ncbi:hypothetical protein ACQZV8_05210 [Magnetococcales bacterium HHB-1]
MEEILSRLEKLQDLLSDPKGLDDDTLGELPKVWEESVKELVEKAELVKKTPEAAHWKERLNRIVNRLPEIQSTLSRYQSEIADQIASENRRLQALRSSRYAVGGTSGFFHRQA